MNNIEFNANNFELIESVPSIFGKESKPNNLSKGNISWIDKFFRAKYLELFSRLQDGQITVVDSLGTVQLGEQEAEAKCTITMLDISNYTKVALGGSNGSAQAYIDGLWVVDDLTQLIRIFLKNRVVLQQMETGLARIAQTFLKGVHALRRNTRRGSKKNIAAHYDLGNDFFRLFLDKRMMYSSALYQQGDDLHDAALRKIQRVCDALELSSEDHVIEIGTGWGGLACYAASTTGCRVTSVTISREQFNEAVARVEREGLQELVTIKLQDYRDIKGQYDKLISIEMIEAIGHQYLDTYFKKVNHLLKPRGKALIQAIVIDDHQYKGALKTVDYIKKYIFPGGFMPCYSVISQMGGNNNLMLEDLHDMGLSYAQTLRDWRKRFYDNIDTVNEQGYDQRFQRMWEFYLCYCEGAFDERAISVGQLLFRKQGQA
jgi:cyclopropane-fatty-acyl-phospholipid synthase